ncbi:MAG: hypothetical protein ABID38_01065 [Candidatus Diapherotrites archaeon]
MGNRKTTNLILLKPTQSKPSSVDKRAVSHKGKTARSFKPKKQALSQILADLNKSHLSPDEIILKTALNHMINGENNAAERTLKRLLNSGMKDFEHIPFILRRMGQIGLMGDLMASAERRGNFSVASSIAEALNDRKALEKLGNISLRRGKYRLAAINFCIAKKFIKALEIYEKLLLMKSEDARTVRSLITEEIKTHTTLENLARNYRRDGNVRMVVICLALSGKLEEAQKIVNKLPIRGKRDIEILGNLIKEVSQDAYRQTQRKG